MNTQNKKSNKERFKHIKAIINVAKYTWQTHFFHISLNESLLSIGIYVVATFLSFLFLVSTKESSSIIAMIYILAVFIVSRFTQGVLYGIVFSVISVFTISFLGVYPLNTIDFSITGYGVTFTGMMVISIITSLMSTGMKDQSEILVKQEKELAEAEKEKVRANLLRAVSHDLRTPLTGIIGNSSSILENHKDMSEEEKLDLVKNIYEDSNWLLNMVENLLTVTRIDGKTSGVNTNVEIVDDVVSAGVSQFKKRFPKAEVHVKLPEEVILCKMDPMLISQVIINILQNSYMHSESDEPIDLFVTEDKENAIFHIRDYGVGIAPDKLDTIFDGAGYDPEEHADSHKGMGIGLSICKTIILAHSGEIWAINHDKGCEFVFTLKKEKGFNEPEDNSTDN